MHFPHRWLRDQHKMQHTSVRPWNTSAVSMLLPRSPRKLGRERRVSLGGCSLIMRRVRERAAACSVYLGWGGGGGLLVWAPHWLFGDTPRSDLIFLHLPFLRKGSRNMWAQYIDTHMQYRLTRYILMHAHTHAYTHVRKYSNMLSKFLLSDWVTLPTLILYWSVPVQSRRHLLQPKTSVSYSSWELCGYRKLVETTFFQSPCYAPCYVQN